MSRLELGQGDYIVWGTAVWEHEPNLLPLRSRRDREERGQLDILTCRREKKSNSVPEIKTKYILIILTCQASCKNYSP